MVKISFLRFQTQIAQIEMICCFKLVQKLSLVLNTNCVSHIGIILAILMKRLILTRNYFMLLTICSATPTKLIPSVSTTSPVTRRYKCNLQKCLFSVITTSLMSFSMQYVKKVAARAIHTKYSHLSCPNT